MKLLNITNRFVLKCACIATLWGSIALPQKALCEAIVGSPAPSFQGIDINNTEQTVEKYKGKFVVLEWTNPGCPFVKKHYGPRNMQKLQQQYTRQGVIWLTIVSSAQGKQGYMSPDQAKEWLKEQGADPTALILDPQGTIGHAYGASTTPHMFIVNPVGTVIYAGAIDDNEALRPDAISTAKNYVTQALDEALNGKPVSMPTTEPYGCGVKY